MEVEVLDDFSCAVCGEIFLSSMVLCCIECDHSFCNCCLERFWIQHGIKECPLCFKANPGLPFRSCEVHGRRLFLICVADLEPVCSTCHGSGRHMNHIVYFIKEAFINHKAVS
ncbi:hypothetical protein F7725_003308 [Dissostichus mawsoni]|uniref:RING-type domain-containing protein n=1 Tax=Dissostichus mawsoni TaxID=36200 RepID=A0A7J5Y9Z3_DISMA|nr:hypothetical protein F7725_003308 [Dissostichus mawsoni]